MAQVGNRLTLQVIDMVEDEVEFAKKVITEAFEFEREERKIA